MTVSIVTVCLNRRETIRQTIESVINQSHKDIEYIIIDGGSTDGTLEILSQYKKYFAYFISEPDRGIYDAMNKGIGKASGEIILFINSDDWYADRDVIKNIVEIFGDTDCDVVYGDYTAVDIDGRHIYHKALSDPQKLYYGMITAHPAMAVRTLLLKKKKFDTKYRLGADYKFFLTLFTEGKTFKAIDQNLAFVRLTGESGTHLFEGYSETCRISHEVLDPNKEIGNEIKEEIDRHYWFLVFQIKITGNLDIDNRIDWIRFHLDLDKEYFIFGLGRYGKQCFDLLKKSGITISGIIDNAPDKIGSIYEGVKVVTISDVDAPDCYFIIATTLFEEEIRQQLIEYGIDSKRILSYRQIAISLEQDLNKNESF